MSDRPYYKQLAAILHKAQGVFDAQDSGRQVDIGSEVLALRKWCDESATALREQAERIATLEAENERLQAAAIHSCHANCQRTACVLRRRVAELEAENERLRSFLYYRQALARHQKEPTK